MSVTLETSLKGVIGDRTAAALKQALQLESVGDLLRHYPRRYIARGELSDISTLVEGDEVTILAAVKAGKIRRVNGRTILEVVVSDGTSTLSLTFFNQAWRERELKVGIQGMFAGKIGSFNGKRQLSHPEYQLIPDGDNVDSAISKFAGKFIPVYPSAAKMPSWKIQQCVEIVLDALQDLPDYLPSPIVEKLGYPSLKEALVNIHIPDSREIAETARERLTFDEALLLQLILAQRRAQLRALPANPRVLRADGLVREFEAGLPFSFTRGQVEVSQEIERDMSQSHPMHRLLQGEVGSGKTVIALRAMLSVVDTGGQSALLAPTEVLAQQHFKTIRKILGPLSEAGTLGGNERGTQVALLTGSMSAATKREVLGKITNGEAGIVIGTHALLSENVDFADLGLVVIDEQHRFGVEQRDAMRMKASVPPHLLVMTATPIPRTVAMTIFGDLDISTLRELPSGRKPITTHVVPVLEKPHYLDRAWERVCEEAAKGRQVYIVAPRISATQIEEGASQITDRDREIADALGESFPESSSSSSGKFAMNSVEELAPKLATGALKGLKIAVLHGRQSSEIKDETMAAFSDGKIDVLIATTVIEVGVDVPNASMMVIMDADRFGVSQLHQLRGRVGRGKIPGLCLLVSAAPEDSSAMLRINAVASTLDGFLLSRIDLDQRREGDVLGRAQSGTRSHLRLLRVLRDEHLIEKARDVANSLVKEDPNLNNYPLLLEELLILSEEESSAFVDKG